MPSFADKRAAFERAQADNKTANTPATRQALADAATALSTSREVRTARRDLRWSVEQHHAADRRDNLR
ncbi:hypothetical protein ACIBCR_15395 [Micromonospora echinospora]|uniref:hypothetical protein n=1 Tax=Micromonospora echinospora TaxID=1877 RepID=UPI00378A8613